MWEKTGLFNLRLSSDAPNLQVENEETIEALSARTKALLDGIQQRFLFVRSLDVNRDAFADRHGRPSPHPQRKDSSPNIFSIRAKRSPDRPRSLSRFFSFSVSFCCLRAASTASAGTIGYDRSVNAFAGANSHSLHQRSSRPMSRQ
ncbi:hypothetical protein [Trinickia dabaoshanensis]|uniref:hypothetical protein n=1 Tax=Trinickia dabaoshanensis TaxID=564714 RepID=UPI0018EC4C02|nr:hypothetical protein [Trinickia dabaoshanensis]